MKEGELIKQKERELIKQKKRELIKQSSALTASNVPTVPTVYSLYRTEYLYLLKLGISHVLSETLADSLIFRYLLKTYYFFPFMLFYFFISFQPLAFLNT